MRSAGKPARPDDAFRPAFGNAPLPTCGALFRDLRVILRMSHDDAAAILSTRPDVIVALESDNFLALPPWPETVRIVNDYTGLAGIDSAPMLSVLQTHVARYDVYARHDVSVAASAAAGAVAGAAAGLGDEPPAKARMARLASALMPAWTARLLSKPAVRWGLPVSAVFALFVALTQASGLQASVSQLPAPIARWVMSAQDFLIAQIYPRRDGFVWIEVADPRSRRGDKLTVRKK